MPFIFKHRSQGISLIVNQFKVNNKIIGKLVMVMPIRELHQLPVAYMSSLNLFIVILLLVKKL